MGYVGYTQSSPRHAQMRATRPRQASDTARMPATRKARDVRATQRAEAPTALVQLPPWLWGGSVEGFADAAQWRADPVDGVQGTWRVRLRERMSGPGKPKLLEVKKLASAKNVDSPGAYSILKTLPAHAIHHGFSNERISAEIEKVAAAQSGLSAVLNAVLIASIGTHEDSLPGVLRQIMRDQLLPHLPSAEIHLVTVNQSLNFRFSSPRVLLLAEEDPEILDRLKSDQFRGFKSARGLAMDVTYGLSAYLAPLALSTSPYMVGMLGARAGGVLVFTFGTAVPGRVGPTVEGLQLFHPRQSPVRPARPNVTSAEITAALRWWVAQLNLLFSELTDPVNYTDSDAKYIARRQFERQLSVEQAFRNVQSISALDRDSHAQRVLALDTLDTLEGMRLLNFDQMCQLKVAERTLDELRSDLPEGVGNVLLPRGARAVEALRNLQSGFFLDTRLEADGLRVPDKHTGSRVMPLDKAAAAWLRILRNAGHAFGGKNDDGRARAETLLLAHDGEVPEALADLAYLYLLRMVAHPETLRTRNR